MSGHSKWHSIKHKKALVDAKRGKLFTRLIREVMVAARMGGSDIETNPRLRTAVQAAKDANMPKDTIERTIKKGAGELEGTSFEDFVFEGYASGGVALIVEGSTDNMNRTAPEIRHIFGKQGGNLGEPGSVAWMFDKKSLILVDGEGKDEDTVMEVALEAGADDFEGGDGIFTVTGGPNDLFTIREAIEKEGLKIISAELKQIPKNTVESEGKDAEKVMKLVSALEDHDDVTSVSGNFEIAPELIEQFSG